ncbi:MAG: tRNA (adenosine(37)-N6)-threonylcarbamoyltransferase complex transferase subunit TsaD [Candidatus Paceibacterota bacterium]
MIILGIETSCDDTCAAIIEVELSKKNGGGSPSFDFNEDGFKILSNIVSSQVKVHRKYGGVFPSLAKREHQKNLAPVIAKAIKAGKIKNEKGKERPEEIKQKEKELKDIFTKDDGFLKTVLSFLKKTKKPKIDALAVTIGPGLEPSLWQGINFSRALSLWWDLPIIPINHIEGHILANFIIDRKILPEKIDDLFPAICLIASGGHTQLVLMERIGSYRTLGESRDDAAGECLDKTARILGLSYPGGPIIYEIAKNFKPEKSKITVKLPRPMIFSKNYDFSFSGLKTAVLYEFKKREIKTQRSKEYIRAMAYEIQKSIIDTLTYKTLKAAKLFQARSIIMGGGVTANEDLKKRFLEETPKLYPQALFLSPAKNLSTDNAAMVCIAALFNLDKITSWKNLEADANLRIR